MDSKPIISKRVSAGTRVYYFDANVDRKGQPYMSISEIPTSSSPQKKRQRLFIHAESLDRFEQALKTVADQIRNGLKG